jgi:hypothetical protein
MQNQRNIYGTTPIYLWFQLHDINHHEHDGIDDPLDYAIENGVSWKWISKLMALFTNLKFNMSHSVKAGASNNCSFEVFYNITAGIVDQITATAVGRS